jgi:uncharacterized protein (DUF362 family)
MKVAIIKQSSYDVNQIKEKLIKGLESLKINRKSFSPGDKVLIKPNMALGKHYDNAICTHPALIKALCEILSDFGVKITIGDSPGYGSFISAAKKSGYAEYLKDYSLVEFKNKVEIANTTGGIFKKFNIAEDIYQADKVINVCKFKTHGMMLLTLAVKNMFGSVIGLEKPDLHFKAGKDHRVFASYLSELCYTINPFLNITDAIIAMEGNGPVSGAPKPLGFIAMSKDAISLDIVSCKAVGFDYNALPVYNACKELSLGETNIDNIEILPQNHNMPFADDFKLVTTPDSKFDKFTGFLGRLLPVKPVIIHSSCVRCMVCVNICPAKIMSKKDGKIDINYKGCIHCFCCQEFCEYSAVKLKKTFIRKTVFFLLSLFGFKR